VWGGWVGVSMGVSVCMLTADTVDRYCAPSSGSLWDVTRWCDGGVYASVCELEQSNVCVPCLLCPVWLLLCGAMGCACVFARPFLVAKPPNGVE